MLAGLLCCSRVIVLSVARRTRKGAAVTSRTRHAILVFANVFDSARPSAAGNAACHGLRPPGLAFVDLLFAADRLVRFVYFSAVAVMPRTVEVLDDVRRRTFLVIVIALADLPGRSARLRFPIVLRIVFVTCVRFNVAVINVIVPSKDDIHKVGQRVKVRVGSDDVLNRETKPCLIFDVMPRFARSRVCLYQFRIPIIEVEPKRRVYEFRSLRHWPFGLRVVHLVGVCLQRICADAVCVDVAKMISPWFFGKLFACQDF